MTAKDWLTLYRNKYSSRAEIIRDCSKALDISKRSARKAMKKLEDDGSSSVLDEFTPQEPSVIIDSTGGFATMDLISKVPKTPEELVEEIGLDETIWEITKGVCNFWGNEDNPNYQSKIWFKRIISELEENFLEVVLEKMKSFTPVYPKIKYKRLTDDACLFELALYDQHLGQLGWGKETGEDNDLNLGLSRLEIAGERLLGYAKGFPLDQILLPIGNDFFNVNNSIGTTVHGTPQDEDSRWFKVYEDGFSAVINLIDKAQAIAPVEIIVVPGNHDAERIMYFAHALWAWYRNCPNVNVDVNPKPYKFYLYGKNLLGYAHGKDIKNDKLPLLMATEVPELWSQATYWEWHTGHVHHKTNTVYLPLREYNGVRVRTLSSLCSRDSWHTLKGYGGFKEATGLVWHKLEGNIAEFNCHI